MQVTNLLSMLLGCYCKGTYPYYNCPNAHSLKWRFSIISRGHVDVCTMCWNTGSSMEGC
jgi:hypothetical protein